MIPEAVLMEEMKPQGTVPVTDTPKIDTVGGLVTLASPTEGSSIVYQTKVDGRWGDWQLYQKSFPHEGPIRFQACRLGFASSEVHQETVSDER